MEILTFSLISLGFIAVPGPNILVVVSTSLAHGTRRGLQAVMGIHLAMTIQLLVAAVGTAWFVAVLTQGLLWLKWAGVAYLLYLGLTQLSAAIAAEKTLPQTTGLGSFQRGFWVSLTNPKTILFFSAFLPQFAVETAPYATQIVWLSTVFWAIAAFVNCAYTLLASRLASWVHDQRLSTAQRGVSGVLYLGAGAALAAAKTE